MQTSWPAHKIESWEIERLTPYARNAKRHPPEQVKDIKSSMLRFGFTMPVLVKENGTIIAGHGRVMAASELLIEGHEAFKTLPVIVARGWDDDMARAYTLADNKLTEGGEWDEDLLREELSDLFVRGVETEGLGFSEAELFQMLQAADGEIGNTDPDDVPEAPINPVSKPGDIWLLGNHRIICGDSTNADTVSRLLGDVKPHLMVTDPPYGVEYDPGWRNRAGTNSNKSKQGVVLNDDRADWRDAWALFPGDVAYVWHAGRFASIVDASLDAAGFIIRSQIIWAKDRFALSRGDYHWQHEPCWYAVRKSKTGHWNGDRKQSTVWDIAARDDKGHGHGTQKPVECMKRPIENNSSIGQAVYEPFSGSGTTIIAGEISGRHIYAVELNPAYVDVAVKRWQDFTGKQAFLEATEQSFDEVKAERTP